MIKSERIAKNISEHIKTWRKGHGKLVVAIDGYAGSGKTTIGDFLAAQNSDVLSVHLDDFIKHWRVRKRMIGGARDKSREFEYRWYRYDDIEKLVKAFKGKDRGLISLKTYDYDKNDYGPKWSFDLSKKVLVIDGIFLLHPKGELHKYLDKTVYLNAAFSKADKKRVAREKKKWGKGYLPEDHPDNWTRYFKQAYGRYVEKYNPEDRADLVFDV